MIFIPTTNSRYLNKLIDSYYITNYPHDLPDEYEDGDISGEALNDV